MEVGGREGGGGRIQAQNPEALERLESETLLHLDVCPCGLQENKVHNGYKHGHTRSICHTPSFANTNL